MHASRLHRVSGLRAIERRAVSVGVESESFRRFGSLSINSAFVSQGRHVLSHRRTAGADAGRSFAVRGAERRSTAVLTSHVSLCLSGWRLDSIFILLGRSAAAVGCLLRRPGERLLLVFIKIC